MFRRLPNPLQSNSFFLFGARGTGKSTLVGELLKGSATHRIDLLDPRIFDEYLTRPGRLLEQFQSNASFEWIVVDEVQRLPRLLNEVHKLIFETKQKFVLTGSSARKLKRGEANLLAGRAFSYELFPLTHLEYGKLFNLHDVLQWGALPQVATTTIAQVRSEYLAAYVSTYMREEVLAEQLLRNLEGFRKFLKVAAQVNGQIVVYDSIARDVGIDATTVKTYFEILSDTLLGFVLPSYHRSVRKQQRQAPKFYFFDCGVQRALLGIADQELTESSYGYGRAFEHFIIAEIIRLCSYARKNFEFSYLRTKDDAEINLIVERPGLSTVIIEIKSGTRVHDPDIHRLARFIGDFPGCDAIIIANERMARRVGDVLVLPWREGIAKVVGYPAG